jgi:hypothetical protein
MATLTWTLIKKRGNHEANLSCCVHLTAAEIALNPRSISVKLSDYGLSGEHDAVSGAVSLYPIFNNAEKMTLYHCRDLENRVRKMMNGLLQELEKSLLDAVSSKPIKIATTQEISGETKSVLAPFVMREKCNVPEV